MSSKHPYLNLKKKFITLDQKKKKEKEKKRKKARAPAKPKLYCSIESIITSLPECEPSGSSLVTLSLFLFLFLFRSLKFQSIFKLQNLHTYKATFWKVETNPNSSPIFFSPQKIINNKIIIICLSSLLLRHPPHSSHPQPQPQPHPKLGFLFLFLCDSVLGDNHFRLFFILLKLVPRRRCFRTRSPPPPRRRRHLRLLRRPEKPARTPAHFSMPPPNKVRFPLLSFLSLLFSFLLRKMWRS